ncbi:MAG: hypothetical protein KDB27_31690 [Planctomycetales bacterium]|nr:hypothetical protein [Planctomycetales bacterium]
MKHIAAIALLFSLASSLSAIEVGGVLFVDLDAASYTTGDFSWTNNGTYGDFDVIGAPMSGLIESTPVVWFDGVQDAFIGADVAPDGLVGEEPTTTIEAWVFNPAVASEETIVAWGDRGGPDGSNMSFNYGTNSDFGAVGHWGDDYDVGWNGTPKAEQWHHMAYSFDGTTARVYLDGVLNNEKDMPDLETFDGSAIAIAAQWQKGGGSLDNGRRGSLAIGRLRVHDEPLSAEQITANYNEELSAFIGPPLPEPTELLARPIHRYNFNNPAGNASEETIVDLEGNASGEVVGEDAVMFTGTQLQLGGGTSDFAPYVDLPNGIISSLTDATIEGWVTIEAAENTPRIFSFGSSTAGELLEVGGEGTDQDVFAYSAARGENIDRQNISLKNLDPDSAGAEGDIGFQETLNTTVQAELNEEFHFALVYDSDGGAEGTPVILQYRNGELASTLDVTIALENLSDVNNFLGRSNDTSETNFAGLFNEFRIYDYALSQTELLGNIEAGPDVVNVGGRVAGDYNDNGVLDAGDLDLQSQQIGSNDANFDLTGDGSVDFADRLTWVKDLANTWIGDANLDGEFNSGDFVQVFGASLFETQRPATWDQGDWNGDGVFDSGDFVAAFTDGGYEKGARPAAAVPEPGTSMIALLAFVGFLFRGVRLAR